MRDLLAPFSQARGLALLSPLQAPWVMIVDPWLDNTQSIREVLSVPPARETRELLQDVTFQMNPHGNPSLG